MLWPGELTVLVAQQHTTSALLHRHLRWLQLCFCHVVGPGHGTWLLGPFAVRGNRGEVVLGMGTVNQETTA